MQQIWNICYFGCSSRFIYKAILWLGTSYLSC